MRRLAPLAVLSLLVVLCTYALAGLRSRPSTAGTDGFSTAWIPPTPGIAFLRVAALREAGLRALLPAHCLADEVDVIAAFARSNGSVLDGVGFITYGAPIAESPCLAESSLDVEPGWLGRHRIYRAGSTVVAPVGRAHLFGTEDTVSDALTRGGPDGTSRKAFVDLLERLGPGADALLLIEPPAAWRQAVPLLRSVKALGVAAALSSQGTRVAGIAALRSAPRDDDGLWTSLAAAAPAPFSRAEVSTKGNKVEARLTLTPDELRALASQLAHFTRAIFGGGKLAEAAAEPGDDASALRGASQSAAQRP